MSKTARTDKRLDIQGMRALAVVLVVLYHAALPIPGGFIGVDVFFVISGFVISRVLIGEVEATGSLDLQRFYLRRTRRLLPALAATTSLVMLIAVFANPIGTQVTAAHTGMAASLFGANAYLYRAAPGYFDSAAELNPMLHTWSLAVEEQFYMLFPALLMVSWRTARNNWGEKYRSHIVAFVVLLVFMISFGISCPMSYGIRITSAIKESEQFAFYASPTRAWEFSVGVLLAIYPRLCSRFAPSALNAMSIFGFALIVWSSISLNHSTHFPGLAALVPALGSACLVAGGQGVSNWMSRAFSIAPAVWLGDRSYSWYLWHWPVLVFSHALFPTVTWAPIVAGALSLVPACASYRFLETPIRSKKNPSRRSTILLACTCIVVPFSTCLLLKHANVQILKNPRAKATEAALALHADTVRQCERAAAFDDPNCTWKSLPTRGAAYLIGDSNAGQLTESVVAAAANLGLSTTVATAHACPFVDLQTIDRGTTLAECRTFFTGALDNISKIKPAIVVIATASDLYIEKPSPSFQLPDGGAIVATPEMKSAMWGRGMLSMLKQIHQTSKVLIVHPVPRFHHWTLSGCAAGVVLFDSASCGTSSPRSEVDAWRRRTVDMEKQALGQVSGTAGLDLIDALCTKDTCGVNSRGLWLYRDGAHLSVPGAVSLAGYFERAISHLLGESGIRSPGEHTGQVD